MADAAQARGFQGEGDGGNIHAHATHHDGDEFVLAQFQAKIIYAFHRIRNAG
jgi:hypothetical protein